MNAPAFVAWEARERLRARQRTVLDDLLAGRTPAGFDATGTALATRVLLTKRATAAAHVAPELDEWPGGRDAFRRWAAAGPPRGCAHDDVRGFGAWLADGAPGAPPEVARAGRSWLRVHEVHEGRRRFARARLGGRRVWCLGWGAVVHTWGRGGRPGRTDHRQEKGEST